MPRPVLRARRPVRPAVLPKRVAPCTVIVPREQAIQMPYREAVGVTAQHTLATGREAGFNFIPNAHKQLSTPIYQGTPTCMFTPPRLRVPHPGAWRGGFHTHPPEGGCEFSSGDYLDASTEILDVMALACPFENTYLRAIGPGAMDPLERGSYEFWAGLLKITEAAWAEGWPAWEGFYKIEHGALQDLTREERQPLSAFLRPAEANPGTGRKVYRVRRRP